MTYTPEMRQAEANLQRAMRAWNIVRLDNPQAGTGVFIDNDTRQNGRVVPTRMEYVRESGELRVTRITQGSHVFYDGNPRTDCNSLTQSIEAFFTAQPQLEAVFNAVTPMMSIPHNCSQRQR